VVRPATSRRWASAASLADATPTQITYEPRDLMPYAPADIRRSIAGGAVTVTWARRTRLGGGMQDFTGTVPLHESSESYEVYVLDAPFAGDLSRGVAPTSPCSRPPPPPRPSPGRRHRRQSLTLS
jgi:hypothetical protein